MMEHKLEFDLSATSLDAIQRAAYRLSDRSSTDVKVEPGCVRCTVHVAGDDVALLEEVVGDFRNQVLDEVLRERIRTETEGVRNLILSLAFSRTDLISQD
jgi:His-Xaa-Ser system protein HxsD